MPGPPVDDDPYLLVTTPDGRTLEVLLGGDPDGLAWVYHSGSPSAAVPSPVLDAAARRAGLRLVTVSRPGYGGSTPRPRPDGPRVVDDVADTVSVLDALGVGAFVTLGWSGGGPRALACAALLPGRCLAATSVAGVAPHDADGLDWTAGMAPENQAEYATAARGAEAYAAYLERDVLPALQVGPDELVEAMGGLLSPADRAVLVGELATYLAGTLQRSAAQGVVGVRDDGLAAVGPWGFDLADLADPAAGRGGAAGAGVPVALWQGEDDAMVPAAHGRWLAAHLPGARVHLLPGQGHLFWFDRVDEVLAELVEMAGR